MSSDPAIKVEQLSKKFSRSLKRAMVYGLRDLARAALIPQRFRSERLSARLADAAHNTTPISVPHPAFALPHSHLRPSEFWALQDISFEVPKGECLGVIGHNGAGKSTLFSILSGIYAPTNGYALVRGRLQALIALGAGFHPLLSGRENIYLNAAVLGMRAAEVKRLLDDIIEFSEIGEFIDMPIKNYSSGMLVRLGFSVAINLRPDVVLVDEVLAVGDLAFQNKSFAKMRGLLSSGVTVLFVSHSPQAVEMVSNRALWLDHGRVQRHGAVNDVLREYVHSMQRKQMEGAGLPKRVGGLQPIYITRAEVLDATGAPCAELGFGRPFVVRCHYVCETTVAPAYFQVRLRRAGAENTDFATCCMLDDAVGQDFQSGSGYVDCIIERPRLAPGPYEVLAGVRRTATCMIGQAFYQDLFTAAAFFVSGTPQEINRPGLLDTYTVQGFISPMLLEHRWEIRSQA